ncbi:MAG: hypothetical protein HQL71_06535 [Magnetococcales bacterium]|nr:hypothetical protein [Magnetococcales bacterium]
MKLKEKKGILYPGKMKFRSWIVAGTPGCGKSYLIDKIGGWPGEVAIDISMKKWWTVEPLSHRPREVHFSFPYDGMKDRFTVYDDRWSDADKFPKVDWDSIKIPNKKKFILAPNWRARFVFDFILPPPEWILKQRKQRYESADKRPMDWNPSRKWIQWQAEVHWGLAWHFHNSGLQVIVRPFNTARPYSFKVLQKIMRQKNKLQDKEINPDLNWSKVRNVGLWVSESAPKNLVKKMQKK